MTVKIRTIGGQSLSAALEQISQKLARNTLKRAVHRGAEVIADEARLLAPHETGKLRDAIVVRKRSPGGVPTAVIQIEGDHSFLAIMAEYGTMPHKIDVKKAEALKLGDKVIEGPVLHSGAKPHPFMRPAFDAKADDAVTAVSNYLADEIERKGYDKPEPDDPE